MSSNFLEQFTAQFGKLKQVVDQRNKNYNVFIINLMTSIGGLAEKIKDLNNALPTYLSRYGSELENSNKKISELQNKLAENQTIMEKNTQDTSALKEEIVNLNNQKRVTTSKINDLTTEIQQITEQSKMEKIQFQTELTEKTRLQNEDFSKQIEQRQGQFEEAKKQLELEVSKCKEELASINNETGNIKSQLNSLTKENNQLKEENNRYITSITNATASIAELLDALQKNPRDDQNFKKIQNYVSEIEVYMEKISGQLQGRGNTNEGPSTRPPTIPRPPTARPPTARPPTARPPTARPPTSGPENTPELNEEDFEGGRRRQRRKTKRVRKQKGGFIHSIFHRKSSKSHKRKSSRSKKSW